MQEGWLRAQLTQGRSIESIARQVGRHPSTVWYWAKRYGLRSPYAQKQSRHGTPDRARMVRLIAEGKTVREIAHELGRGPASVRYWLDRYELKTERQLTSSRPRDDRPLETWRRCRRHGMTRFVVNGSKRHYRCAACRSGAVARRRRVVKRILVEEAGGRCRLCGYDRYVGALHFHHIEPDGKAFELSLRGVTRSIDSLREEASKCVLLCANCHAEVEAGSASITA